MCGVYLDPPDPATLSHLVCEKLYKGTKLSPFSKNSKIQKCVCGGVHLSSVITINIFHVFNMQFLAALMGKHKENKW